MIPRLSSNVSFKANEIGSARETYETLMANNNKIAQTQSNMAAKFMNQVPMQGTAQKLDIIA
ncbi:MAG: hypothetical protein IKU37_08600 [Candidatus Gastranaerophilales bacterium]|nr:hypothetical protein [Candidatus Gastranaerophilales bacterium]